MARDPPAMLRQPDVLITGTDMYAQPYTSDDEDSVAGDDLSIDSELEAAIEYKIATAGVSGAATVLEFLNQAVRRYR